MATKANITIHQGSTYVTSINMEDQNDDPIPLTGYTGAAQIRKHFKSESYYDFTVNLDEAQGMAYVFARKYLIQLDLKEKKASLIKDYLKETEFDWSFKYVRIQGNHITFSAGEGFKFASYFGVICKKSKEILWSAKCNSGSYLVEAPKINKNKLYVLDSDKTLYVYEKKEEFV
mgnify:CR=1 FL=1